MAAGSQQKHLSLSCATKGWIYLSRTKEHYKNNTFSYTWTVRVGKFPKYVIFDQHDSSLGRHVNSASRRSLEIQAYSITKTRTHSEQNVVWVLVFSCSYTSCNLNLRKINSFLVWIFVVSSENRQLNYLITNCLINYPKTSWQVN